MVELNISWIAGNQDTTQNMNKFVLGGGKNVVDDNTIHRGARMVFLILNFDTQLGRSQIVDKDHDKFVERFSRRCN